MSSRTAIPATASVTTSVGAPLNEIAAIARRRASSLTSDLGTDVLVQRTLQRFDETFGTTSWTTWGSFRMVLWADSRSMTEGSNRTPIAADDGRRAT